MGLKFDQNKHKLLRKSLHNAANERGYIDHNQFVQSLIKEKNLEKFIHELAPYLTISETYFFRDPISER